MDLQGKLALQFSEECRMNLFVKLLKSLVMEMSNLGLLVLKCFFCQN